MDSLRVIVHLAWRATAGRRGLERYIMRRAAFLADRPQLLCCRSTPARPPSPILGRATGTAYGFARRHAANSARRPAT